MGAIRTKIRAIKVGKAKKNKTGGTSIKKIKTVSRPYNKPKAKTVLTKKKLSRKGNKKVAIKKRVISKKAGERKIKRYNKKKK
tara:strand:+ start:213 stop:461 length:249 start_codon:yes stop_codon:yes gene_type:complete